MILTPKVRKTLDVLLRLIISIMAVGYIVYRLQGLTDSGFILYLKQIVSAGNVWFSVAALLALVLVNWGLESYKWKRLIGYSEKISFARASSAVLGGLTVSVFTPNRVGEFVGRVFVLKKTEPVKGIMFTLVGSYSQLLTTVIAGTVAYAFFAPRYLSQFMPGNEWLIRFTLIALDIATILFTFLYFNISLVSKIADLLPSRYKLLLGEGISIFEMLPNTDLAFTLLLSIFRYLVFATQFYLALLICGAPVSLLQALMVIPVIYLVLAAVPTIALTELGIRGSVSVFLFGITAAQGHISAGSSLGVISASTLLWVVNIALPALAGVWVVLRLKFFRR